MLKGETFILFAVEIPLTLCLNILGLTTALPESQKQFNLIVNEIKKYNLIFGTTK